MIIDCGVYRTGVREDAPDRGIVGTHERACETGGFAWIGLYEPTAEEIDEVTSEFGLHPLLVEDALKAHQRAKAERHGDADFIVLKTAWYVAPDQVRVGEIQFIVGPTYLITIRHGDGTPIAPVRAHLEAQPALLAHGPAAVLHAVADAIVDDYVLVSEELERDVDEAETEVFSGDRLNPAERIFGLKRQVLELLRNVLPMSDVLHDIQRTDPDVVSPELAPYFRDVDDHLRRVLSRLELVRELLGDALDANLAQVSVRQNDDMRKISAWAAIIAAPTMLAGVWGMNFSRMPELDWEYGYLLAISTMVVAVGLLWRRFKRVGWI